MMIDMLREEILAIVACGGLVAKLIVSRLIERITLLEAVVPPEPGPGVELVMEAVFYGGREIRVYEWVGAHGGRPPAQSVRLWSTTRRAVPPVLQPADEMEPA